MPHCGNRTATQTLSIRGRQGADIKRGENPRALRFPRGILIDRMNLQRIARSPAQDERASAAVVQDNSRVIETSIPTRLDNLSWSGFHTRVVLALGITWILDGLEVTLAGALSGALKESPTLQFSNFDGRGSSARKPASASFEND